MTGTLDSRTRRGLRAALLGSVIVGLAGCGVAEAAAPGHSASGGWSGPAPDVSSFPHVRASDDITLPLSALELSSADTQTLYAATQKLRAQCLARFGVASTDVTTLEPESLGPDLSRRYGVVDLAVATTSGYHPPTTGMGAAHDKGSPQAWDPSTVEYQLTFGRTAEGQVLSPMPVDKDGNQLPLGGCVAEAQSQLRGASDQDTVLLEQIGGQSSGAAEADARVQAAWAAWSQCMKAAGFVYDSPWQPNDSFTGSTVTDEERRTAVADVQCKQSTNLVGIWSGVEGAYQQVLLNQHSSQIANLRAALKVQVAAARSVLAGR